MTIKEILKTTKMSQGKVYLPIRVREILEVKDNDIIVWCMNDKSEIMVKNAKTFESKYDFL